jgi:multiple sugar transport system permease protein
MSTTVTAADVAPGVPAPASGARRSGRSRRGARSLAGIGYASPTALVVTVLFLVPLVLVGWMSLNKWPLLGSSVFNAPDNYSGISDNSLFVGAVWFTLKYTVIMTVVLFAISFGLALLVQHRRKGVGFYRTAFFLPGVVGFATASLLFLGMLSNEIGPIDPLLTKLGVVSHPISWTSGSPAVALTSTVVLVLWRFAGFNMLILLTGLQAIPLEVYEAARIDGAGAWHTFRKITVPLMRPTLSLVLIMMVTGSLLAFDQFYILTRGGPDNSTTSVVMVVVREAFIKFNLGSAAAISVVVLAALVVLNAVQLLILRRRSR